MAGGPRFRTREEYEAWRNGRGAAATRVPAVPEPLASASETSSAELQPSKLLAFATGWFFLSPVLVVPISALGVLYYAGDLPLMLLALAIPALLMGIPGWFGTVGLWRGTRDGYFYASLAWAYATTAWSLGLLLSWSSLEAVAGPVVKMLISMAVLWTLLAQLHGFPPGTGSSASDPMGLRFVGAAGLFGVVVALVFTRL